MTVRDDPPDNTPPPCPHSIEPSFDYDGATKMMVVGRCATSPDRGPSLARGTIMANATCSVEGCDRKCHARGLCGRHYSVWKRKGDPLWTRPQIPAIDLLLARTDVCTSSGCWIVRTTNSNGYGMCTVGGSRLYAHRVSYEAFVGPIPVGLHIDHLCRNRACVNPDHLEPVTQAENTRRGASPAAVASRTNECQRGHEFSVENTYVTPNGRRQCRQCARLRERRALS